MTTAILLETHRLEDVLLGVTTLQAQIDSRRSELFDELDQALRGHRDHCAPGEWAVVDTILGELRISETASQVARGSTVKLLAKGRLASIARGEQ